MIKFVVSFLVLWIASVANATVTFELEEIDVPINSTGTFNIVSDNTAAYTYYVGNEPGLAEVTDMQPTPNAGPDAIATQYDGYWSIEAKDNNPDPWDIIPGIHWIGTVTAYSTTGTYLVYMYDSSWTGTPDTLTVNVIPEPTTLCLLALGTLALLRKRRQ